MNRFLVVPLISNKLQVRFMESVDAKKFGTHVGHEPPGRTEPRFMESPLLGWRLRKGHAAQHVPAFVQPNQNGRARRS